MHIFTTRRIGALAGVLGLGAGLLAPTVAAQAQAVTPNAYGHLDQAQISSLGAHADQGVIVLFRDQAASLPATTSLTPARRAALARTQAPVLDELHQLQAPDLHTYSLVDAVSAKVSAAEEARLAADPAVARVVPDQSVHLDFTDPATAATGATVAGPATAGAAGASAAASPTSACQPGSGGVELDPQALEAIHANSNLPGSGPTAASLGITGAGVKVAFIAEGFHPDQPNFIRADGKRVVVDEKDFTGEGIGSASGGEASLDASSIAAQGNVDYKVTLTDGKTCTFTVLGAAPGASLVGLKVFSNSYLATTTSILEAIDYAVATDHVNVLNESFGYNPLPDTMTDVVRMADEAAVAAGTVVDVSSGDAGPTSTVGSPSTDPAVISAGASTTYRVYAQEPIAPPGVRFKGWEDDNLSGLSSAGFTEGLHGVDLLAPGDLNWVSCNPSTGRYGACISGGTSEAAPLTSATAALVIQAYGRTHGGAVPSPALVKQIITSTTTDLGLPADQQGSGLLNSYEAVLEAESVKTGAGSPAPKGMTLQTSTNSIDATAAAGTTVTTNVSVTNTGARSQKVDLAGRILSSPTSFLSTKVGDQKADFQKKLTFQVPAGTSYLSAHAALVSTDTGSVVDVDLVDPLGRLAIDGLPQGATNASNVGVRYPAAGTWTAYITYSGSVAPSSPIAFDAEGQNWQPFGTVTPATLTLAPGATSSVQVSVPTPAAAGDETAAVQLTSAFGQPVSIPIALRTLVPLTNGTGTFSAQVFGGNGRTGAPSSTQYFQVDVPSGAPELTVATAFANGPDNQYSMYLVSPSGEALGHASNQLVVGGSASDPYTATEPGAVSHVLDPAAGRWTVVLAFAAPATGTSVAATLQGHVGLAPVTASAKGLPASTGTDLTVGQSHVVAVTVKNTTSVPESYFLDARLSTTTTKALAPLTAAHVTLPLAMSAAIPQWIVPTDTTALLGQVDATAPVTFDMSPYLGNFGGELNGDPQITATSTGDSATATWSDTPVTPGVWNLDPALTGVFGTKGAPSATADLTLQATTLGFDLNVHTSYGDLWRGTGSVQPVVVGPGRSTTLYAVIDPTAAGATHGTIFVDTSAVIDPYGSPVPAGDQVAALPYAYTAVGS